MSKVDILVAKIENGRYLYEKKQVEANRWIDIPPYATQQNVLIQDYIDNISLGWVQSVILPEKDGTYKISGLTGGTGGKSIKYYMIIPFPFEDSRGWVFTTDETEGPTPKKSKPYLVTVETLRYGKTSYRLATAYYDPKKYSDWVGYDYRDGTKSIIAWRNFPRPKTK